MALNLEPIATEHDKSGLSLIDQGGRVRTLDGSPSILVTELLRLARLGQAFERFAANIPNTRVADAYDDTVGQQGAAAGLGRGRVERF